MKDEFLFLGFISSKKQMEEIIKNDKFPQYQTYKFTLNFLKALEHEEKYKYIYISSQPVSDYPHFNRKYFKYSEQEIDILNKKIKVYNIPFYNTGLLKILTRTLSSLFYGIKFLKNKRNKKGVIIYSVHIPYMLTGIILGKIFKTQIIGVWTDPPSVPHHMESKIKKNLRGIEFILSKILMKKMDKVIVVTKYLAEDFAPKKPYLVIEGIVNESEDTENIKKSNSNEIKIVYTGTLDAKYGIKNIIEAFKINQNQNILFEVYGKGNFEEELKRYALLDSRIKYYGFVDNKKILSIQKNADFLINARSNEDDYTKYSFPSKMMEYMTSGTPIITTILNGFPDEYKEYLVVLKDNSPIEISKKINEVLKWDEGQRKNLGKKAKEFILKKSYINQSEKIKKFINY